MRWVTATVILLAAATSVKSQEKDSPGLVKDSSVEFIPDASYRPRRGEKAVAYAYDEKRGKVYTPGGATYAHVYEEYWKSLDINDNAGTDELRARNVWVRLPLGTELLVIETQAFPGSDPRPNCAVVRVMSGEHEGKKLWMAGFQVTRLVPNPRYAASGPGNKRNPVAAVPEESPLATLERGTRLYQDKRYIDAIDALRPLSLAERGKPVGDMAAKTIKDAEEKLAGIKVRDKAARLLVLARNLEKSQKFDAALVYYRQILKESPNTSEAKVAAARIKAIQNQ